MNKINQVYLEALSKRRDEVIEDWVKALTNGKYSQGWYCLRSGADDYCCLGVLIDVVRKRWVPTIRWRKRFGMMSKDSGGYYIAELENSHSADHLIVEVREALGISKHLQEDLILLNDGGFGFGMIAAKIKRELGGE